MLSPCEGVVVLRPHLTAGAPGFHDDHIPQLQKLLAEYLGEAAIDDYWLWFYTPMAMPLAAGLSPAGVVYDCMDELSAFRHAPRQLLQRESALLQAADLVFTGGQSLYESKRERHPRVHCFPSSVDAPHFARAPGDHREHEAQAGIGRPRLGYCGVIDERIDLDILAALADAHADWQIVAVGPVVKIDPATLPQRPNIHWLGQRGYDELPALIGGWDVCLMPFALNEATRYISPTKTLEYMAAGRPVVSTPIHDVVGPYAGVVSIAHGSTAFVEACEAVLARGPEEQARQASACEAIVRATSWDRTADEMASLIEKEGEKKRTRQAPPQAHGTSSNNTIAPITLAPAANEQADGMADAYATVILGAGPTGLAAALHAGHGSLLVEQNATVGGWCRSVEDKGFTFDYAGHIMFSNDPYVLDLYKRLLGDNVHWQDREAWIYSKSVYTRYPFQSALHGLPPPVLKECLIGAIEARFGSIGKPELRVSPTGPSRAAAPPAALESPAAAPQPASPPAPLERHGYERQHRHADGGLARGAHRVAPELGAAAHLGIHVRYAPARDVLDQALAHLHPVGQQQHEPVPEVVFRMPERHAPQAAAQARRRQGAAEDGRDAGALGRVKHLGMRVLLLRRLHRVWQPRRRALLGVGRAHGGVEVGAPADDVRMAGRRRTGVRRIWHVHWCAPVNQRLAAAVVVSRTMPGGTSTVLMQLSSLLEKM